MCFIQRLLVFVSAGKRKNERDPLLVWVHPGAKHTEASWLQRQRDSHLRDFWVFSLIWNSYFHSLILQQFDNFLDLQKDVLNWQTSYVIHGEIQTGSKKYLSLTVDYSTYFFSKIRCHGCPPECACMYSTWLANAALCHMLPCYTAEKLGARFYFFAFVLCQSPLWWLPGCVNTVVSLEWRMHTALLSVWTGPIHCRGSSWDAQRNHCVSVAWQIEPTRGSDWKEHSHVFMGDSLYFQTNRIYL